MMQISNFKLFDGQHSNDNQNGLNVKLRDVQHSNDKLENDVNIKLFDVQHSNNEVKLPESRPV